MVSRFNEGRRGTLAEVLTRAVAVISCDAQIAATSIEQERALVSLLKRRPKKHLARIEDVACIFLLAEDGARSDRFSA